MFVPTYRVLSGPISAVAARRSWQQVQEIVSTPVTTPRHAPPDGEPLLKKPKPSPKRTVRKADNIHSSSTNTLPHSSGRSLDLKSRTATSALGVVAPAEVDASEETGDYGDPNEEEGEREEQPCNGANEKYELFPTLLNVPPHKVK